MEDLNSNNIDIAPPAAPLDIDPIPLIDDINNNINYSEKISEIFLILTNIDNYYYFFNEIKLQSKVLIGEDNYNLIEFYTIPILLIFLWTLFVYYFAYYRAKSTRESILEGEMMKTQAEIFKLEKDFVKREKRIKSSQLSLSSWKKRIWLLLISIEIILGVYFYFFHQKSFFPSIPTKFLYISLIIIPIILLVFLRIISMIFSSIIKRNKSKIKQDFKDFDKLKGKYFELMEENNHRQVGICIKNIDKLKKSFDRKDNTGNEPKIKPIQTPIEKQDLPRPSSENIPPAKPLHNINNTPQNRENRTQQQNINTAPVKYTQQAPPLNSPYVPPKHKDKSSNNGLLSSAMGIISGSYEVEPLICEFCSADNGTQPKHEIKQFKCRKCLKLNGLKHINSKNSLYEKKETKKEKPEESDETN